MIFNRAILRDKAILNRTTNNSPVKATTYAGVQIMKLKKEPIEVI
eukprot:CAMPEP_0170566546 /NCGR_PEP_ID=MMETSP0211-20121228/79915_1 /TAXON_ID=311385 /ORGANISM="Pseudokeronopsis sp., Strain OXSARD2" /LENGTH=44 /DNA_ID= /DNA_START= /DNA_END= /DNA_ORIENTATION=